MPTDQQETREFMKAYTGLKTAAATLEEMARQQEPDLDKMLVEVKRAKDYYDKCSKVIDSIKAQVETLLGEPGNSGGRQTNGEPDDDADDDEIKF